MIHLSLFPNTNCVVCNKKVTQNALNCAKCYKKFIKLCEPKPNDINTLQDYCKNK